MAWISSIFLGAGAVAGIAVFLLLSLAICYDLLHTRIPAEFDHPYKLRIVNWLLIMAVIMAKIIELLGICKHIVVLRFFISLLKTKQAAGVSSKDFWFDGIPVRVYRPKAPFAGLRKGFVFFHGGIGMLGTIEVYERFCSTVAKDSNSVVVSVGYRLAPEHPFPAQWEDCLTATVHFMKHAEDHGVDPSQVIIGGDSAGGNFASVVAQKLTEQPDLPKLRAQVLIYACLQVMDFNLPSYQQNYAMPPLPRKALLCYGLQYANKDISLLEDIVKGSHVPDEMRLKYRKWMDADNIPEKFKHRGYKRIPFAPFKWDVYDQLAKLLQPSFSSLLVEDSVIPQLPETFIVSCEYDVLRDDSLLYKRLLEQHGVKVTLFHAENGFHGAINVLELGFSVGFEILDKTVEFLKGL